EKITLLPMRGVKNIDLLLHVKNNIFHLFPQKSYPMHTTVQVLGVAPFRLRGRRKADGLTGRG
ncbi:MAG: hypothetical protein ACK48E_00350, partial [Holosporales bacterium]